MKLTIKRNKWLTGREEEENASLLLNKKCDKMCCLGIYLRSLGVGKRELAGVGTVSGVKVGMPSKGKWLRTSHGCSSEKSIDLMVINDSSKHTDKEREALIKKGFKEQGVEVEFVGEY